MPTTITPDLLPFRDARYRQDPFAYIAAMRHDHPVYRSPSGHWVISRYEDVASLLYDRTMSVEQQDFGPLSTMHDGVLASDPPKHTRLRRSVSRWFTPKMVARWTEVVREETDRQLKVIQDAGGRFDAVFELAFPVSFRTMSRILGVPFDEAEALRTRRLNDVVNPALGADPTPEEMTGAGEAMQELLAQTAQLIAYKEERPGDGLIDALLELERNGDMARAETAATVQLLATVGYQDTSFLIATGLRLLAEMPDVLDAYRADPESRQNIINEVLRYTSPEQFVSRLVTQPTTVSGVTIPAGESVLLFLAAANRDPDVFDNPDTFDHTRDASKSRHLAFSAGLHACVGQMLVRAQAETILTAVVTSFTELRTDGDVEENHTDMFRTVERVPLAVR